MCSPRTVLRRHLPAQNIVIDLLVLDARAVSIHLVIVAIFKRPLSRPKSRELQLLLRHAQLCRVVQGGVARCGTLWHVVARCGTLWHVVARCGVARAWRGRGEGVARAWRGRGESKSHSYVLQL